MAELTETQRDEIWSDFMQELSREQESLSITKGELRAALVGLDAYIEANQGAINSAIPQPARTELTIAQKAKALAWVTLKRYGVI